MTLPKVSIVWLNYNSSKFFNIVLKSLEAIVDMDYPKDKYELIVVDNGSVDGSFECIVKFLEGKGTLRSKIVRLNRNLGFTGGANVGFSARDPESKYIVLLNNDAIPMKHSLTTMVEYAEKYDKVAALNGVILQYDGRLIDTAGCLIDEMLSTYHIGSEKQYPWVISKPLYITYANGAYALYRTKHILNCVGKNMFINEFFAYGDDNILGLMLWNCGYPSISIPIAVAKHSRGSTFISTSKLAWYLEVRNRLALSMLTNTRLKGHVLLYSLKGLITPTVRKNKLSNIHIRALYDAFKLYSSLHKNAQPIIDIYKAPIIPIHTHDLIRYMFTTRERMVRAFEKRVISLIKLLELKE